MEFHVPFVVHKLMSVALTWWETIGYNFDIHTMTWDAFERLLKDNYFNVDHRQAIVDDFESLHQGAMTVTDYYNRFMDLAKYSWVG